MADELVFRLPEPGIERFLGPRPRSPFGDAASLSSDVEAWLRRQVQAGGRIGTEAADRLRRSADAQRRAAEQVRRDALENARRAFDPGPSAADRERDAAIGEALDSFGRALNGVQLQAETGQAATVEAIANAAAAAARERESATGELLGAVRELADTVERSNREAAQSLSRELNDTLGAASREAARSVEELSRESQRSRERAERESASAIDRLRAEHSAQTREAASVTAQAISSLRSSVDNVVAQARAISLPDWSSFKRLGEAIGEAGEFLGDKAVEVANVVGEAIIGSNWQTFLDLMGLDPSEIPEAATEAVRQALKRIDPDVDLAGQQLENIVGALPDSWLVRALMAMAVFSASVPRVLWDLAGLRARRIAQEYNLQAPTELLPPPDAIDSWRRGDLKEGELVDTIRRAGYSQKDVARMISLRRIIASPSELLSWWLRDLLKETELDSELQAQGWSADDVKRQKKAAFTPPPIGDLIRMAVREVFSPQQRRELQLDADYPEALTPLARQQGISEEFARDYWAAHWQLPSIGQAFEMLHRGEIDQAGLDSFLRAADISPAWREKLTAISFRVFTRVDIRRMFRLGILSESELTRAHQDLGYDADKAAKLTRFVVALEAEREARVEAVEARRADAEERRARRAGAAASTPLAGLSRAQLRAAVAAGELTRPEALQELVSRGSTPRAADIFLALGSKGTPRELPEA